MKTFLVIALILASNVAYAKCPTWDANCEPDSGCPTWDLNCK